MENKEIDCPTCGDRHEWPACKPKLRDVHVWLKPEQFDAIARAAEQQGLSITAYVRSCAVQASRERGNAGR